MAAFDPSAAKRPQVSPKDNGRPPIEWLLMQINADAVCLVRTQFQFQQLTGSPAIAATS